MFHRDRSLYARLLCGASVVATVIAGGAQAQERARISIEQQPLASALNAFGVQTGQPVISTPELTSAKVSRGVKDVGEPGLALSQLLAGTGLSYRCSGDTYLIVRSPESGPAPRPMNCIVQAGAGASNEDAVDALIVTAQKREENIQDVPIAISAFTQEELTTRQVAGGPDLMTQVPNMTFTKTNFSSYSIQLRGIGTQAISATTDAAVAVAFNNTPFIRNRFFEQEFYDLERVEVLRGPQGTLYGRNATAGVVNLISAKPSFGYESRLSADIGNFSSNRLEGMVNIPLADDKAAIRLAGAWTQRDGYATNQLTSNPIDGRDLWSTRLSLRFEPTDRIQANLIWEHFEEDDDRLRSGKQLCKTHDITEVVGMPVGQYDWLPNYGQGGMYPALAFSQGCVPASMYSKEESFQTPNGLSLPYYYPLSYIFLPAALPDPYVSRTQSRDLRVIESAVDPEYRAKTDLAEIQLSVDLTDTLTLASETSYLSDFVFSMQDYNRFNTAPGAWMQPEDIAYWGVRENVLLHGPDGGIFCDPQLGCSDRMVAVDVSTARSRQFSQEFRLSSNFDGDFNFSLGANYLRYDTEDKYYVFINSLSLISAISPYGNVGRPLPPYAMGEDNAQCLADGFVYPDPTKIQDITYCTYMDPNPIGSLNDMGHNYFLSKNPYKLISYALFGETYFNLTDNLKLTAGLRWTVDRKEAPRIPSWVLASDSVGYPTIDVTRQEWSEPTDRLTLDWKPDLAFTDDTMIYASLARGYKAGGANPPPTGPVAYCSDCGLNAAVSEATVSKTHPKTFDPEYINSLEIGAKNVFLDGRMTLNMAAFYYDYEGYQISQIVNRSAVNLNFDAEVWGLEIEADWRPLDNLRLGFKGGYESTRVADGEAAIDLMDRTAGKEGWVVVRPFPTYTSNCILPEFLFVGTDANGDNFPLALGGVTGGNPGGCELAYVLGYDPVTQAIYEEDPDPADYGFLLSNHPGYEGWNPAWAPNNGEGFDKQLGGNELPNAPNFTGTLTVDYTLPLPADWLMTLHGDLYYQSEAWTRIFNTDGYDKLKAYTNVNLAALFTNDELGLKAMFYVKNVFDRDSITGSFLNSDDTGLTTNVFLTEPRLFGVRVTKDWSGGPWRTGVNPGHKPGDPYAFTVELGGMVQRHDAPADRLGPSFAGVFPASLDPNKVHDDDLDTGDGREIRLTYRPGGPWTVSAGLRYGKANATNRHAASELDDERSCLIEQSWCAEYGAGYFQGNNFVFGETREREEHTVVDFLVGREVGFGTINAGLRYADLNSRASLWTRGVPDWVLPPENIFSEPAFHTRYDADVSVEREFAGAGPALSWEAERRLFGDDDTGHVDLDWTVEGAVLFGRQETTFQGGETATDFEGMKYGSPVDVTPTPAPANRSKSATVPVFGASLGLSYEVSRIKVSGGYRWERYFDAVDAGYAERDTKDRTIDGPYLKIAVGFGG